MRKLAMVTLKLTADQFKELWRGEKIELLPAPGQGYAWKIDKNNFIIKKVKVEEKK